MTKTDSKKSKSKPSGADAGGKDRKHLLAQVAAHVAASVVADLSEETASPAAVAEISVDIAEAILQRVGL